MPRPSPNTAQEDASSPPSRRHNNTICTLTAPSFEVLWVFSFLLLWLWVNYYEEEEAIHQL